MIKTKFNNLSYKNEIKLFFILVLFGLLLFPDAAMAAGGINVSAANELLTGVQNALFILSAVIVTIAVAYVAYQTLWKGQAWQECTKIIVGAAILASASTVGAFVGDFAK